MAAKALIQNGIGQSVINAKMIPNHTIKIPNSTVKNKPLKLPCVQFKAAAAGPINKVNTKSTPTTWLASVTATATITINKMEINGRETPFASANSGSKLANNNGLAIKLKPSKLRTE